MAQKVKSLVSAKRKMVKNPHDSFFKAMCENINVAIDLLKASLPAELFSKIKLNTLRLTDKSFVSSELRQTHSDMIYEAEMNGHLGYIAFVLEDQATPHRLMAFRKLEYNVGAMRKYLKQGEEKLPVVINICLYHGKESPYPYSTSLFDCFSDPELAKEWMFQLFHLVDLSVMPDDELEQHGYAALMEFMLKHCRDTHVFWEPRIEKIILLFKRNGSPLDLKTVLFYLLEICGGSDQADHLLTVLEKRLPEEEEAIMTFADQLRKQGLQQAAREMIQDGVQDSAIQKWTKLSSTMIKKLKQELNKPTAHQK